MNSYEKARANKLGVSAAKIINRPNRRAQGWLKVKPRQRTGDMHSFFLRMALYGSGDNIARNMFYTKRSKSFCKCCGQSVLGKMRLTDNGRKYLKRLRHFD